MPSGFNLLACLPHDHEFALGRAPALASATLAIELTSYGSEALQSGHSASPGHLEGLLPREPHGLPSQCSSRRQKRRTPFWSPVGGGKAHKINGHHLVTCKKRTKKQRPPSSPLGGTHKLLRHLRLWTAAVRSLLFLIGACLTKHG